MNQIWVVSGCDGAGKATALDAFARCGFTLDRDVPVAAVMERAATDNQKVAMTIDVTEASAVMDFVAPPGVYVLYLDASDRVLIDRLVRARICPDVTHAESWIDHQRELLQGFRAAASVVVDTSALTNDGLRKRIYDIAETGAESDSGTAVVQCLVSSFGYKYGAQPEAGWVIDCRCIPNPFWIAELRPLTGEDPAVCDYVLAQPAAQEFVAKVTDVITWYVAHVAERKRQYVHLAFGCTGGRHRSVVVANEVARRLGTASTNVHIEHRDIMRPDPRDATAPTDAGGDRLSSASPGAATGDDVEHQSWN